MMEESVNSTNEKHSTIHMDDFKSTVNLADSKASGLNEKDQQYDPFANREVLNPNSDEGALAHLLKGSLGSGILAMPNAFKNAGIVIGLLGTVIVGLICTHCVHILVRTSHYLCKKSRTPMLDYASTAEAAFKYGPKRFRHLSNFAKSFVNWSLVATYYSAACVYVVFISLSFKEVFDVYFPDNKLNVRIYMLIFLIPLICISEIRSLKYLVPFSALANLFIVVGFTITLYYLFQDLPPLSERKMFANVSQLPLFFSTVIFAMEGIGVVMPLENSMKHPTHFIGCPGVLNISMGVVVTLYTVIGFVGYLQYGEDTEASVTLNLPDHEVLAQTVKILVAIAILFTYGLQFFVPTQIVWSSLKEKVKPKWRNTVQNSFRAAVVTLTVAISAAIPNLGPIISLVGAICFSNLGLLCPAVIEIVAYYEDDASGNRFRMWKNILIIIFAVIAAVSGTYASILDIIKEY